MEVGSCSAFACFTLDGVLIETRAHPCLVNHHHPNHSTGASIAGHSMRNCLPHELLSLFFGHVLLESRIHMTIAVMERFQVVFVYQPKAYLTLPLNVQKVISSAMTNQLVESVKAYKQIT